MHPEIAVIGGSGLYQMPGLEDVEEHNINTPFGNPSSPVFVGTLEGKRVAFLARHGIGHSFNPSEVNYRANIYALKTLGVEHIISVSASGSLREDYAPGNIVVPDQLFDFTKDRKRSFFEDGIVAHVSVGDSFCEHLSDQLYNSVQTTSATHHRGGTLITIEGPRFSTRGESNIFRNWGLDLIGMTTSPEAFLAREAEICYAVFAHVTDYDVWHMSEEEVTVEMVMRTVNQNTEVAHSALRHLITNLDSHRDCDCPTALKSAIMTDRSKISADTR
ncbi:MAG: S-methyl-5'-thioadenosine phosphorylase, partial [Chloroflexota bacterium]